MIRRVSLLVALALLPTAPVAARSPRQSPGMVSAADPRAAAAGVEILRAGGSATDAAIAMMLALNVVEPQSSGIGGGGFMVQRDGRTGVTTTFDGRETAPAAADARWFYKEGQPLSHGAAIPGGRSVGVPGNLRMMALAHARSGRLPWARLFVPAIRLARDGFAVTPRLHNSLTSFGGHVDAWARAHFFDADAQAKAVGTILKDPGQAGLFERIARQGPDAFYTGANAAALVATVNGPNRNPSRMTLADLAAYRAKERPPVCGTYRTWRICGMGPPSSGGITVLMILKQLERFDLAGLGPASPVAWHLFAESERLAYADRDTWMGDADHVPVPVAGLLDPAYLARRSALIRADTSMTEIRPGRPAGAPPPVPATTVPEHGTTDMVAVDARGDVAQVTSTIESPFGSGLTLAGLFLNNELTDFDIVPDKDGALVPNRVGPGKRPRSSMAPTIVTDAQGHVRIALGAAGGSTIIAQVAKALIAVLDWRMSAQDAIALGLLYAPGPTAIAEQGTQLDAMVPALTALGERVKVAPLGLKANAIERVGGRWAGAADPRSEGVALGEDGARRAIRRTERPKGTPSE